MSKHSVKITKIYCCDTSESKTFGGDEVYIIHQADGGLPIRYPELITTSHQMQKKDTWELNNGKGITLKFDHEVLVTLWDLDVRLDPNLATYLQSYDFQPKSRLDSGHIHLKNHNGAEYKLYYTYLS